MNTIPDELYGEILIFLSLKEKIRMRKVNKIFKSYVNPMQLSAYKLENRMRRVNTIEQKMKNELVCEFSIYNDFKLYKQERIHSYFRMVEKGKRCVTNCMAERIGYIYYLSRPLTPNMCLYNKRYIPYCIHCFQKWQIK